MLYKKTFIALAAAIALGCVPVATNALAAGHPRWSWRRRTSLRRTWGRTRDGRPRPWRKWVGWLRSRWTWIGWLRRGGRVVVRSGGGGYTAAVTVYDNGPIYDSCSGYGYGYGGCPGYGVPIVGAVISGILGGYGGY